MNKILFFLVLAKIRSFDLLKWLVNFRVNENKPYVSLWYGYSMLSSAVTSYLNFKFDTN